MGTYSDNSATFGGRNAEPRPTKPARGGRADALAVATLLVSGAVVGWPVLGGGYLTYLDNPAHIAEVYAAAFEAFNGWSEIAFCGFPIAALHSPLWYGALSLMAKIGLPVGPLYACCVWLGFVAPAVALYAVARRALAPIPSAALAYLLLVQRPAIVGVGSAFGGMWTFFLSAAGLILLVDRLARECVSIRDMAWIAALVGFIVVTHLYAVVPLMLLALYHSWWVLGSRRGNRDSLVRQAVAGGLGILAAAVYWAPLMLARDATVIVPQNLTAAMISARLAIPTEVLNLINGQFPPFTPLVLLTAAPMIALLGVGTAGVVFMMHRRDNAPVYGLLMAATLLLLLFFLTAEFDTKMLGPGSWRMLYFVRVGLALAAIPALARLVGAGGGAGRRRWIIAAAVAVAAAWWFGAPLRAVTPPPSGPEMAEVGRLWEWLEANRSDEWGRVYLQDTFERPRPDVKLSQSHVLALTAYRSGVRQLGATYGVSPYRTALWTTSDFGMVFRRRVGEEGDVERLTDRMWASNATHIVTSDAGTSRLMGTSDVFERLFVAGRFSVFRATAIRNEWASALGAGIEVDSVHFRTGRYRLKIRADRPGDVLVKSSYHPAWRFSGLSPIRVHVEETGLMRLKDLPAGQSEVAITFRRARWPRVLSAWSWFVIIAGLVLTRRGVSAQHNP
jgi:hypothetical protein